VSLCVSSSVQCSALQLSLYATALCIDLVAHAFHPCWRHALLSLVGTCYGICVMYFVCRSKTKRVYAVPLVVNESKALRGSDIVSCSW